MGFKQPTPIQKACVPVGLMGKDICACAATGTGMSASLSRASEIHSKGLAAKLVLSMQAVFAASEHLKDFAVSILFDVCNGICSVPGSRLILYSELMSHAAIFTFCRLD